METKDLDIVQEVVEFLRQVSDKESTNRANASDDIRFRYGDQWENNDLRSRQSESRPFLTINETDTYCRQITNQQRQQRPRIKVHPVNDTSDVKVAKVINGLIRHIEVSSDADNAYDIAFDSVVTMGWGYWRILTDYVSEDSFDQDISINAVIDPFSVYFDSNSILPDGSDATKCLITDLLPNEVFKKLYPNAEATLNFNASSRGDTTGQWFTKDTVRIAEFFKKCQKKDTLCLLSDKSAVWKDHLPSNAVLKKAGITIVSERESYRSYIEWYKVSGSEILEKKIWPGKYIPVVPVYGNNVLIDGKTQKFGVVKFSRDPQKMINFWHTAVTESLALAPKAKWLLAEGQDEGHESEWATANINARPVLRYKQTDIEGMPAPRPERLQPEAPPEGLINAAQTASNNLQKVMGIFDPAMRNTGNVSGKALNSERMQSDNSNFHFYDNLTRSMKHTGRILLDLIPHIYDTERILRIIGEDDSPKMVTINEKQEVDGIQTVLNDVTVGLYDVVMDIGPGYDTKRQEAVDTFTAMLGTPLGEKLAQIADDVIVRQMDVPGADIIADRLAAANPLSKIDEESDIPPQVQMQLQQMQSQLQQMQQQLQQAEQIIKTRSDLEQMKQDNENKREHMRLTVRAHDVETRANTELQRQNIDDAAWRHDVEVKSQTALSVSEIKAIADLLSHHIKGQQAEKVAQIAKEQIQSEILPS